MTWILIKLATWLVKYLIDYNWGLSKELEEAKNRTVEHQTQLDNLNKELVDIDNAISLSENSLHQEEENLAKINTDIDFLRHEHERKIKETNDAIDSKSNADILGSDLRTDSN